jgi:hypothetical protein
VKHILVALGALALGWEAVAVETGHVPTISALCRRHRVVAALVWSALAVHLVARPVGRT